MNEVKVGDLIVVTTGEKIPVDRNILNTTAKLLDAFFNKDNGLFATLFSALGRAFGFDPKKPLEPIIKGIELFTSVIESFTNFFAGPTFQSILSVFKPFSDAIKGIKISDGISVTEINNFIDGLFEGIRGLFRKIGEFIKNVDAKSIGDVIGNFFGEIIASLPDLLVVVFSSITKLIDIVIEALNSKGFDESAIGKTIATFLNGVVGLIPKIIELIH